LKHVPCGGRRVPTAAATLLLAASVLLLVGCAGAPRLADVTASGGLPPQVELTSTPFFPQADQQCGPAALATVLGAAGRETSLATVSQEIFLPGRQGSLQPEIVAAIRARGLLPYEVDADLAALFAEVAAGRPVLVLQRQGFGPWPAWHYAVVIGYDAARDLVTLRSGTRERLQMRAAVFDATWSRAQRWGIVALVPGTLPERTDLSRYLAAAAGFEAVRRFDDAQAAYAAAISQWPYEPLPRLGVANVEAALGHWREAARGYADVLRIAPGLAAAINNRAEALSRLGCRTLALRALDDGAARLAPDDPLRPTLARTLAAIEATPANPDGEPPECAGLQVR
jgi:tetratricopeptide (TPR) repeat protein